MLAGAKDDGRLFWLCSNIDSSEDKDRPFDDRREVRVREMRDVTVTIDGVEYVRILPRMVLVGGPIT